MVLGLMVYTTIVSPPTSNLFDVLFLYAYIIANLIYSICARVGVDKEKK